MAGFNFNQRTEYSPTPLSIPLVEQVLHWDGIEAGDSAPIIARRILDFVNNGALVRDFRRWCISPEAPECVSQLSKKWAELLFCSVVSDIYSCHRHKQNLEVSSDLFPFWQIYGGAYYCKRHSSLDGFVARPNDPVWNEVYPPNGWMCGCSVLAIMKMDVRPRTRISRPISEALRLECTSWLQSRPDHILHMI